MQLRRAHVLLGPETHGSWIARGHGFEVDVFMVMLVHKVGGARNAVKDGGDGHMGLCWYGMGWRRWASGIESRFMICIWFQGRSWLVPFVCDIGGGQGGVRTFGRCLSEGDSRRNIPPVGSLTRVARKV